MMKQMMEQKASDRMVSFGRCPVYIVAALL